MPQDKYIPRKVEVTILITSGVPSPVMTLEPSEIGEYRRLLASFVKVREDEDPRHLIFTQYRGMRIKEYGPGEGPVSEILLWGRRIVDDPQSDRERGGPRWRTDRVEPYNTLERYLLDLARDKNVLSKYYYAIAIQDIEEHGETTEVDHRNDMLGPKNYN